MKKLLYSIAFCATLLLNTSCADTYDGVYVSTSGDGSIVIDYDAPSYLYRLVLINNDEQQQIYLMGNTAYIDTDAQFKGRGAVVKLTIPNSDESTTLSAQNFDIDNSEYIVSYSRYINYSIAENESTFTTLQSGTVIIRKSGQLYDIRLLGLNENDENVLISYRGYIYRTIIEE